MQSYFDMLVVVFGYDEFASDDIVDDKIDSAATLTRIKQILSKITVIDDYSGNLYQIGRLYKNKVTGFHNVRVYVKDKSGKRLPSVSREMIDHFERNINEILEDGALNGECISVTQSEYYTDCHIYLYPNLLYEGPNLSTSLGTQVVG